MTTERPKLLILCSENIRQKYILDKELNRANEFIDCRFLACDNGEAVTDRLDKEAVLHEHLREADGLVISFGSPIITGELMDQAPNLRFIGDMDGDRFAGRLDVDAAWSRGIMTVDTTNGTSYPVAEWALALIIISLRNAGEHFRNIIAGKMSKRHEDPGYLRGDLTGKRVGLIGCGHIGRRLIKFLKPFDVDLYVYDPYLPAEMPDALGFTRTTLENILMHNDVIVCLAPITPRTRGMLGQRELALIPSGAVFVNVSRGAIVDSQALIDRLKQGDIIAGLDVFDPEPFPSDSEIIHLPNVFLSPHIAGVTAASYPKMFELMVDELDRFFHGHETLYALNPRSVANRQGIDFEG